MGAGERSNAAGYSPTRWVDIMRGTWEVGRMVLKVWGLGAEGRMVPGMFWKSAARRGERCSER